MTVHIVTDSAADLTAEQVQRLGVTVVPLTVRLGDHEFTDVDGPQRSEFHRELADGSHLPHTAAPAPGAFVEAFMGAAAAGADAVVCITMSSELSGTIDAARTAALVVHNAHEAQGAHNVRGVHEAHGAPDVHVVDSGAVSAGLGSIVGCAAAAAATGADAVAIVALVNSLTPTVRTYAMLDTLEYLRKGGRIGGAAAALATMLAIKPVVTLTAAGIDLAARPRTRRRAMEWMHNQLVCAQRDDGPLADVTVIHTLDPDGGRANGADQLVAMLTPTVAPLPVGVCAVGAVIASHSGPGMIGVSWRTTTRPAVQPPAVQPPAGSPPVT